MKGRLSYNLPVFAARGFQAEGLTLVSAAAVIDWADGRGTQGSGYEDALIAFVIGVFVTIIVAGIFALMKSGVLATSARVRGR